jgi:hypothetical protein
MAGLLFYVWRTPMKYLIDRADLPYDAFVNDPSWLCPVDDEEGGDGNAYAETEEVQADTVHGEGQPVR